MAETCQILEEIRRECPGLGGFGGLVSYESAPAGVSSRSVRSIRVAALR